MKNAIAAPSNTFFKIKADKNEQRKENENKAKITLSCKGRKRMRWYKKERAEHVFVSESAATAAQKEQLQCGKVLLFLLLRPLPLNEKAQ